MTMWDTDERGQPVQLGGGVYTDYYMAGRDLGALGRNLPDEWRDIPNAVLGYQGGMDFRRRLAPDAVEQHARKLENERWLHQSPRMVRAYALHQRQHQWVWTLIERGVDERMRIFRKRNPGVKAKTIEKAEAAALEKAKCLLKRKRRMWSEWFDRQGFPWPTEY